MKTPILEQIAVKDRSQLRPFVYKVYTKTILKNTGFDNPNNLCDVGAGLQAKLDPVPDFRVVATGGWISFDGNIEIKFDHLDNDAAIMDTSIHGKMWTFNRGDFLIDKIYFRNEGYASDVDIEVWVYADLYSKEDESY